VDGGDPAPLLLARGGGSRRHPDDSGDNRAVFVIGWYSTKNRREESQTR
jgi:hypothetical protein